MREADARTLAGALVRDFPDLPARREEIWRAHPPVKVIDCVLSLNRPYRTFVWPHVDQFQRAYPLVKTCADLKSFILSYPSPAHFMAEALKVRDTRRAVTLVGILDYVLDVQAAFDGATEEERLRAWARAARPGDHLAFDVPGFGLGGFQYLRLLFGADTAKPDVRVVRYVSQRLGRRVTDVAALYLLERAAAITMIPVARIDGAIWEAATGGFQ